jgi:hypothetical protein
MKPQAQRAYEAYKAKLGEPIAPWEHLPTLTKEAWHDAIVAAVDTPTKPETLTDKQIRLLQESNTVKIGKTIKEMLPPDQGFILMTVEYGPNGNLAYISTVERDDAVRTLREWLKRQGAL